MKRGVVKCFFALVVTAVAATAGGDDAYLRTFGNKSDNSATAKVCEQLGSKPGAISHAGPWKTEAEALSAARAAIGKLVSKNPNVEYESTIVKDGNGYRITNPTTGTASQSKHCISSKTTAGVHYHPGGMGSKGQASMTDLMASNSLNIPEYILVETYGMTTDGDGNIISESSRQLSPYMIGINPNGKYNILKDENGKAEKAEDSQWIMDLIKMRCDEDSSQAQIAELLKTMQECGDDDLCKILKTKEARDNVGGHLACEPSQDIPAKTFLSEGKLGNVADQSTSPSAYQCTIDNRQAKQYMSQQLEGAYSQASAMAAEAGVGAEYQSAVAPVMSYGRSAISSIPDQQTYTVPTSSAQGGGYSSQTMDEFGKRFAEQGPCSAGLWLEANK